MSPLTDSDGMGHPVWRVRGRTHAQTHFTDDFETIAFGDTKRVPTVPATSEGSKHLPSSFLDASINENSPVQPSDSITVPRHKPSVPPKLHNVRQQERKDYSVGPSSAGQRKRRSQSVANKRKREVSQYPLLTTPYSPAKCSTSSPLLR